MNIYLNNDDFNKIRKIVFNTTGISLSENKKSLIVARLAKRFMEKSITDFGKYIEILNKEPSEILVFINLITTNLTYFYREADQFVIFRSSILPEFITKNGNKNTIRIWSAACSTGAEVYTILFEILEFFNGKIPDNIDIKILGSDIDTAVLSKAKKGAYTKEELNKLEEDKIEFYFNKKDDDLFVIKEKFKKYVGFRKINLVYDKFSFKGDVDMIFCRNVAIYFDDPTKDKIYRKFHNVLSDKGYIFSGQSENLFKWSSKFKFVKKSIYKKVS